MDTVLKLTFALLLWIVGFCGVLCRDKDKTVILGQTAELDCTVDFDADVRWLDQDDNVLTHNEQVWTSDPRFSVDHSYAREWILVISKVRQADEGTYTCMTLVQPTPQTQRVNLIIAEPPTIIQHSPDSKVMAGTDITMECNATGLPDPIISWHKYDYSGQKQELGVIGSHFQLTNVTEAEAGMYECEADNSIPPAAKAIMKLEIKFLPTLMLPYERIPQERGKDTLLQCIITANPLTEYRWEKDGETLVDGDKYQIHTVEIGQYRTTFGVLVIDLREEDFGAYTCFAGNDYGTVNGSMTVYEPYTGGPKVLWPPEDIISPLGHDVLMPCSVDNLTPKDALTWWWNSPLNGTRRIFTSQESDQRPTDGVTTHPHKFEVAGHYDLEVKDVRFEDAGEFVCEISTLRNYTAALTIVDHVECSANGTVIDEGLPVHLLCSLQVKGHHQVTWDVEWQHKDRRLSSINLDDEVGVSRLVTFPMRATDAGEYRCEIASLAPAYSGSCNISIQVIENEPTAAPSCGEQQNHDVLAIILGITVAIVAVMFIVILCAVVKHYRKELEKYRQKTEERSPPDTPSHTQKRPLPLPPFFFSNTPFVKSTSDKEDNSSIAGQRALQKWPPQHRDGGSDHSRGRSQRRGSMMSIVTASDSAYNGECSFYVTISEVDYRMSQEHSC